MHAGKLEQVTNFRPRPTIGLVGGTAITLHRSVHGFMVLFCYCSLGGNIAMPGGLNDRLCHAFLVNYCFTMRYNKPRDMCPLLYRSIKRVLIRVPHALPNSPF